MASEYAGARRLWIGFLAAVVGLVAALAWLGWRIAIQDEQLAVARRAASAETAADLAMAVLERRLSGIDQELAEILRSGRPAHLPAASDAAVYVRFAAGAARAWPDDHLAFIPDAAGERSAATPALADIDLLQFIRHDYTRAITLLRARVDTRGPNQAAYLARLAQNYLAAGQPQAATKTYRRLADLGGSIAGMPTDVAGGLGELHVEDATHDVAAAAATARALDSALASKRLTVSVYDYLDRELANRLPRRSSPPAIRFADALNKLWDDDRNPSRPASGRMTVNAGSDALLIVWQEANGQFAAYAAETSFVCREWLGSLASAVAIASVDGRPIAGPEVNPGTHRAVRLASARLPFTVLAGPAVDVQEVAAERARRRLLAAGISVMLALTLLCTLVVGRAVARELAVARLQSDFVSAVSHEFRTPLTTLCQLSELLDRGRVTDDAVRQSYYRYLRSESDRLRRLVEGLLTFGRLREGRADFRFQRLDAAQLARQCVADFSRVQPGTHEITIDVGNEQTEVEGDADALGCALWNLLENAVKYSPAGTAVQVGVRRSGANVAIAVTDQGVGVHPSERHRIFDRFVRGRAALKRAVAGTGIGLATAREILRAHRGEVEVESDGANGSTFTLVLPARA
jgi:signal transduction histidine kinase